MAITVFYQVGAVIARVLDNKENDMIRIPTGLFGLIGLLLTVLPTAAPASVNKPTAEERGLHGRCAQPVHRSDPQQGANRLMLGFENVSTQPALPRTVRQGGRPLIG
jgi:hypothetical protein